MLVGIGALAVIGYVVGLRAGVPRGRDPVVTPRHTAAAEDELGMVWPALSYDEVGAGALRSRERSLSLVEMMSGLKVEPGQPVSDMAARRTSLATRAERRAFNGAPPTIPHAITGLSSASCTTCHGQGVGLGELRARGQPHEHFDNCTQCHAPAAPAFLQAHAAPTSGSTWSGIGAPTEGPRAYPDAPPAIPHTLHMRRNCAACHGVFGWPGMQTTHPERTNCLQCHAPIEDRGHPGRGLPAPLFLPPPARDDR